MHKLVLSIPTFVFVISLTKGEPNNIVIFPNTADVKITRSSLIEVTSGMNFSLLCRVIADKSDKQFSDHTMWYKKRLKSRFSNVGDFVLMEINNIPDGSLSFTNVSMEDQGKYVCASLKHKLVKVLSIIVKPDYSAEKEISSLRHPSKKQGHADASVPRVARAIYDGYNQDFSSFTYSPHDFSFDSKYDRDIEKWWSDKYENNNYNGYEHNNHDHSNRNDFSQSDPLTKVFYVLFGGAAFFAVIYVIIKCCHDNDDTSDTQHSSSQRNPARSRYRPRTNIFRNNRAFGTSTSCSHIACIQNRSRHPYADCLLTTDSHILIEDTTERILQNNLDLPPTYADSTANSVASSMHSLNDSNDGFSARILNSNGNAEHALPPTYEEALVNIVLSTPDNTNVSSETAGGNTGDRVGGAGETNGCHNDLGDNSGSSGDIGGNSEDIGGYLGGTGGGGGDSGDTGGNGGDSGDTGGGVGDSGDTGGGGSND